MNPSQLITHLNSLEIGELDGIRTKLVEARRACADLAQGELERQLAEADEALGRADLRTYRKRVETVIARLGHLR
jgi:hypothetical protein